MNKKLTNDSTGTYMFIDDVDDTLNIYSLPYSRYTSDDISAATKNKLIDSAIN